uniref:Uncharacterized protein n=1 Tax=Aegilops tauschii subsp. strangulata TaxID=200361 RepID=A0A453HMF2_AEGTS
PNGSWAGLSGVEPKDRQTWAQSGLLNEEVAAHWDKSSGRKESRERKGWPPHTARSAGSGKGDFAGVGSGSGCARDAASRRPILLRPPRGAMETAHEVAIYIDRFHNLDLYHQGWYRMKISAAWEQDDGRAPVSPARVAQYEATDIGAKRACGFWKIDDVDNSFYTQPFRIKYARQDIYLSLMVSFYIPNSQDEGPATSSVMLKFELLFIPTLGNRIETEDSNDQYLIPVHEFRIPHRALLGLHTYCPVHFDTFHPVLVDLTIHIVYLKAGVTKSSLKAFKQGSVSKLYDILKALLSSRELLLEEVKRISNGIGTALQDLDGADLTLGKYESVHPTKSSFPNYTNGLPVTPKCIGQQFGILQDLLERSDDAVQSTNDAMLYTLSKEELLELFEIPVQNASSRAELHRKSIAQMKVSLC